MRIRQLTICTLLLTCSCRFIVDPDQFRDDAGTGTPDAIVDDAPFLECGEWAPKYLDDINLNDQPIYDETLLYAGEEYFLTDQDRIEDSTGMVLVELEQMDQTNGQPALVLRTESLIIQENAWLRSRRTTPGPPLIVAARSVILIAGGIDMGSEGAVQIYGPGANPQQECMEGTGVTGQESTIAGGGGGGGGFGGSGGDGGDVDATTAGGIGGQGSSGVPDGVRGGCSGGEGAPAGGAVWTPGGSGGGAIHLVACESIDIANVIDVSGAGGMGGAAGTGGGVGGGGGGSGGYIGLEAPTIRLDGATLTANGGGGGGGSVTSVAGKLGDDGPAGEGVAEGGDGPAPGGDGGARGYDAQAGTSGSGAAALGGGGGGGGTGYIFIRSTTEAPPGGAFMSPAPVVETFQ